MSGETPTKEGLEEEAAGAAAKVRAGLLVVGTTELRYQGFSESKWETVKTKRDDVEPAPPLDLTEEESNRSEVDRCGLEEPNPNPSSSSEWS